MLVVRPGTIVPTWFIVWAGTSVAMVMLMRGTAVAVTVVPAGERVLDRVRAGRLDAYNGARNDQGAGEQATEHAERLAGTPRKSTGSSRASGLPRSHRGHSRFVLLVSFVVVLPGGNAPPDTRSAAALHTPPAAQFPAARGKLRNMLLSSLVLTHPLGTLLAVLAIAGVSAWVDRRSRNSTPQGGALAPGRALLVAAGAALASVLAFAMPAPARDAVLLVAALVAALRLARAGYAGVGATGGARARLTALRFATLAGVVLLIGQPACDRKTVAWRRPPAVVLLDQSRSLGLRDDGTPDARPTSAPTRAERIAAAIAAAHPEIGRLAEFYDVHLLHFGQRPEAAEAWQITATAPLTGLAAALEAATSISAGTAGPPGCVVLITDGAETVADDRAVRQAAAALGAAGVRLIALGVGPTAGRAPLVGLDPLAVPPRLAPRDRLRLTVTGRAHGCTDRTLTLEVGWNGEAAHRRDIDVASSEQRISETFDLVPPGAGVHRLTATITLPDSLGGTSLSESALVEVRDDRLRVLLVDRAAQTESAFLVRALGGDETFEITRRLLAVTGADQGARAGDDWDGFDVVILGRVGGHLSARQLATLAAAVGERGVGLVLAGGRELIAGLIAEETALTDLCPAVPTRAATAPVFSRAVTPGNTAALHPVLDGLQDEPPRPGGEGAPWAELPPLEVSAVIASVKPAAQTVLVDSDGAPVLVVQDYARGRVAVAAWEATWPWALASDAGLHVHRQLWRQLVQWVSNRRPRAWVSTDRDAYALHAVQSGDSRARLTAGVSGLPPGGATDAALAAARASLTLHDAGKPEGRAPIEIPLRRVGETWQAEWPAGGRSGTAGAGEYEARFKLVMPAELPGLAGATLEASTRFALVAFDPETRPPTANLPLLREAAARTAAAGGRYAEIESLADVLRELLSSDPRQREAQVVREPLSQLHPWTLLLALLTALSLEWVLRRRAGLP